MSRRPSGLPREIIHDFGFPLPIARLPANIDLVIHAGGIVGEAKVGHDAMNAVNVESTRQLAGFARGAGASGFMFLSTGGVYACSEDPLAEDSPLGPQGEYGRSKLHAEQVLREFETDYRVQVLRLFFPYGEGQTGRLIPGLVQRVVERVPIHLSKGPCGPLLTPIYIDDLVAQIRHAISLPFGFIANAAGQEVVSISEIARLIGSLVGQEPILELANDSTRCNWIGSGALLARLTNCIPEVTFREGLSRVVRRYLESLGI
jgi:UDP-glucose 4-epimerase